jgi:hypothetical protein
MRDAGGDVLALPAAHARCVFHMVFLAFDLNAAVFPAAPPFRQQATEARQQN